jgi:hypothetical protein
VSRLYSLGLVSYGSPLRSISYNPFSSLMPDFLRKKKESTPVPASSQRQQQPSSASNSPSAETASSPSNANVATTVDGSEDIFAQVDKLEEDLGISHKKKAKEVCGAGSEQSLINQFSLYIVFSSINTRQHASRCRRAN